MQRIVETGLKLDLHIHSCVSSIKDGKKVKNNTRENIGILINKLNENGVNICSITDHDMFSFEMYLELKKAEQADNSIQKVLPGIEFSVRFQGANTEETIHIIAIFSDNDIDKVQRIESIIKGNRPKNNGAYTEEEFLQILRDIDLNTILIAHQKESLTSERKKKNDVMQLGEERFFELVYSDYFEAFEFKNKKNEIINKSFLESKGVLEDVRFVTGTDCHDWSVYPREDLSSQAFDFPYTYAKCLPTFKGLVMAMTGFARLKRVNSFFNADKHFLEMIKLNGNGETISIPLSRGINVIIGDNSIGKSMLLHALTGFEKDGEKLRSSVKDGYKLYLRKNHLQIAKQLDKSIVFQFDMQGEVRSKFEENKLNTMEFLSRYFPPDIDPSPYKALVINEIERLIKYLALKFEIDRDLKKLSQFIIFSDDKQSESLIFDKNLRNIKRKHVSWDNIINTISTILVEYRKLVKLEISQEEHELFMEQIKLLHEIKNKYETAIKEIETENDRIEIVAKNIDKINSRHSRIISDSQKRITAFSDRSSELVQMIVNITRKTRELQQYSPYIESTSVIPSSNRVHDYEFISRINVDNIDTSYFLSRLSTVLKTKRSIDWARITENELSEMLIRYDDTPVLDFLKNSLLAAVEPDFYPKRTINYQGMDKSEELSAGMDAKIYFDILSYETTCDGVYIIDQPEDNVSQLAIKSYLLTCFKEMGENRQVIIVTHNPQFIVNLDVDNLIYLSRKSGKFLIQSGALEYECAEYSIIDIVANSIDGGLESIQKRWKRYEKANKF